MNREISAFTLIESLVSLTIIGVLLTFVAPYVFDRPDQARKLKISITTFMIAQDPYLRQFVERFTAENQGKAFLTGLSDLGQMIFEDYEKNRIKRI
mgnify:CR=1 FL=1